MIYILYDSVYFWFSVTHLRLCFAMIIERARRCLCKSMVFNLRFVIPEYFIYIFLEFIFNIQVMEVLLTFLYTAKTTIDPTNVQMLLEAANLFQIDLLRRVSKIQIALWNFIFLVAYLLTNDHDWVRTFSLVNI